MGPSQGYYPDLAGVPLGEFFETFRPGNIAPGRVILLERRGERREALESAGIVTVADLISTLSTEKRLSEVAATTGLEEGYLTILRRQARSFLPSPVALNRFASIDEASVARFRDAGLRNSRHVYDAVEVQGVEGIARNLDVGVSSVERIVSLSNLVRVPGIGPVFAEMFLEIGVDSLAKLAKSDPHDLYNRLEDLARKSGYNGPRATEWDIGFCAGYAGKLLGNR